MTDTSADLVFRGGHVHTVDPVRPRAEAVAVQSGRIVALGDEGDIKPWISQRTRIVDLKGGLLVPGFQDAHERAHANDIRRRFASRHVTTGQIIGFGITGGLIPCPAAITVLFAT